MDSSNDVLFLDIDGVLSRAEYGKDLLEDTYGDYCLALHRPSIEALKKLLLKIPSLKVVWISSWAKCERGACSKQNCYIDPLQALELFPWLKERVIGDIFGGSFSYAGILDSSGSKLNAIESYVSCNSVQRYAIVDDDSYDKVDAMLAGNSQIFEHVVHINPFKPFLEDDLPRVEAALHFASKRDDIHSMFSAAQAGSIYLVNGKWKCTIAAPASEPKEESNCPRQYSELKASVQDTSNGKDLCGLIVISYDRDLGKKSAALYTKSSETLANYESYVNIANAVELSKAN